MASVENQVIRLKRLLLESKKPKSVAVSSLGNLFHGTAAGDVIRQSGHIKVSASGFGQRGLVGVALTPDERVAHAYAASHARYDENGPGKAEVLVCQVDSSVNLADLKNCDSEYDIWVKLGVDPIKDEYDRKLVQSLNSKGHGMTAYLKKLGFDGCVIDNTLTSHQGSPEVCVFDPRHVKVVARRLGQDDFHDPTKH